jgi:hypothetical protein
MPTGTGKYTPPTITRYAVFTVKSVRDWEYNNGVVGMIATGTDGKDYKVSDKRNALYGEFVIGAEVKVGYAVNQGKEYILTAEQTGGHSVIQSPEDEIEPDSEKLNPEVKEIPKPVIMPEHKTNPDPKNRAFALSYSKDLWCKRLETGITCSDIDVIATDTVFCAYLDNGAIITKK